MLHLANWTDLDLSTHALDLVEIVGAFDQAGVKLVEIRCNNPSLEMQVDDLGLKFAIEKTCAPEHEEAGEAASQNDQEEPTSPVAQPEARRTLLIDHPVRSGQKIYAQGADLIVMGQVSHGAEVIADGNVHVYGVLRGRALAGATGDTGARILSTCFEAELVAVAGFYLTFEAGLPEENRGKPTLIYLDEATEPANLRLKPINIR